MGIKARGESKERRGVKRDGGNRARETRGQGEKRLRKKSKKKQKEREGSERGRRARGGASAARRVCPRCMSRWNRCNVAPPQVFSRDFFPSFLPPFETSHLYSSIVEAMERKSGGIQSWVGAFFFFVSLPRRWTTEKKTAQRRRTKNSPFGLDNNHLLMHTYLAEDNAGREDDHEGANGVHNPWDGYARVRKCGVEMEERCRSVPGSSKVNRKWGCFECER